MKKRIILTGAGGLIGKKIVKIFSNDYEIIGVYNKSNPETEKYIILDLSDLDNIKKIFDYSPDIIIHAAALTDVDKCEKNPQLARRINSEATREIAKLSRENNVYLIYISTDYVFDGKKGNYKEEDKPNPINVYGLTKLEGEEYIKKYSDKYLIVRTSTPYGSNLASGKDNFVLWLLKKLKNNEKVNIVTDQITSPTLNTNFAKMLKESIEKNLDGILHLADKSQISRYEFSLLVSEIFDLDSRLINPIKSYEINWVAKRPLNSSLNVEKAMNILENKPLDVREALRILKYEIENGI